MKVVKNVGSIRRRYMHILNAYEFNQFGYVFEIFRQNAFGFLSKNRVMCLSQCELAQNAFVQCAYAVLILDPHLLYSRKSPNAHYAFLICTIFEHISMKKNNKIQIFFEGEHRHVGRMQSSTDTRDSIH